MMYVQKCLHGEYYYALSDIYRDTDKTTTILAHSTDTWLLCNNAPAFKENPLIKNDNEFEDYLLEDTVHQGMLDDCEHYFVSAADLEQAQELLKSSIRLPAPED